MLTSTVSSGGQLAPHRGGVAGAATAELAGSRHVDVIVTAREPPDLRVMGSQRASDDPARAVAAHRDPAAIDDLHGYIRHDHDRLADTSRRRQRRGDRGEG